MLESNKISLGSLIVLIICPCFHTTLYCPPLQKKQGIEINCYEPFSFPKTNISCFPENFKPGTQVTYKCKIPFLPTRSELGSGSESSGKLLCTSKGTWKGFLYFNDFNCDTDCGSTNPLSSGVGNTRFLTNPLILNGENLDEGEWPWQASIYIRERTWEKFENKCGGTLISLGKVFMVLTAGHCLTLRQEIQRDPLDIKIVLGAKYLNLDDNRNVEHAQFFNVIKMSVHPEYYPYPLLFHDVGILLLDKEVELSKYVIPACIPDPESEVNLYDYGYVAGFGLDETGIQPNELKKVGLTVVNQSICSEWRDTYNRLNTDELCVGYNSTGKGVCNGDSGSGLIFYEKYRNRQRFVLKGLVSYTAVDNISRKKMCNYYSVFTNVVHYVAWIKEVAEEFHNYMYNPRLRPIDSFIRSEVTRITTPAPYAELSENVDVIALERHNFYRRRHQVDDVHIQSRLTRQAKAHANYLSEAGHLQPTWTEEINMNLYEFSTHRRINVGEIVRGAIESWYNTSSAYNWSTGGPSNSFTQIVWKATTHIGVGVVSKEKRTVVVVCYSPAGNTLGENWYYFKQNVFPPTNDF